MPQRFTARMTRRAAERRFVELHLEVSAKRRRDRANAIVEATPYFDIPYIPGHLEMEMTTRDMLLVHHAVDARLRRDKWTRKAEAALVGMNDDDLCKAIRDHADEIAGHDDTDDIVIDEDHIPSED